MLERPSLPYVGLERHCVFYLSITLITCVAGKMFEMPRAYSVSAHLWRGRRGRIPGASIHLLYLGLLGMGIRPSQKRFVDVYPLTHQ